MATFATETLKIDPWFDMELFMSVSQESRIGGEVMERIMTRWEAWSPLLTAKTIDTGKIKYLLVWLDGAVEQEVEKVWSESPSTAYLYNALAQTMVMGAVHTAIPEIEDAGCAPAPRPTAALREALAAEGVPYTNDTDPTLSLRFAVVTHFPFKGGCEICSLQSACPKGQGRSEQSNSLVLPGFEREELVLKK